MSFLDYLANRIGKVLKYIHSEPFETITVLAFTSFVSLVVLTAITLNLIFLFIGLGIIGEYALFLGLYVVYYDYTAWKKEKQE